MEPNISSGQWRTESQDTQSHGYLLALFLLLYNNVVNLMPREIHDPLYVWLNLGVLVLVWILGRRYLHLTLGDIGVTRRNLGLSILHGLGLTAVIVLPFLLLLWLLPGAGIDPRTPRLETIARNLPWGRMLIRIPIGTAFFEEMLFRGIFYGYLLKKIPKIRTIWITSIFFGFWHIVPAYRVASQDIQITAPLLFLGAWILLVFGSIIGGALFAWVRHRTNNILGCVLAHALINDLSLLAAYAVWQ